MQSAESPDSARRVAALYTPNYWTSKYCKWTSKYCKMNSPLRTSDRLISENQSAFRFTSAPLRSRTCSGRCNLPIAVKQTCPDCLTRAK